MFGKGLALDIFEDDAIAQPLYAFEPQCFTDEPMVKLAGDLKFFLQVFAALQVIEAIHLQSLDNHLFTFIYSREHSTMSVSGHVQRLDVLVVSQGRVSTIKRFKIRE